MMQMCFINCYNAANKNRPHSPLNMTNLLRLGPGASSAGGIFVPTAPMGGRDE